MLPDDGSLGIMFLRQLSGDSFLRKDLPGMRHECRNWSFVVEHDIEGDLVYRQVVSVSRVYIC